VGECGPGQCASTNGSQKLKVGKTAKGDDGIVQTGLGKRRCTCNRRKGNAGLSGRRERLQKTALTVPFLSAFYMLKS
jgi:hypothetical protein